MAIFVKKGQFLKRLQPLAPSTISKMVVIFGLSIKNGVYFEFYKVGYKKAIPLLPIKGVRVIKYTCYGEQLTLCNLKIASTLAINEKQDVYFRFLISSNVYT